MTQAFIIAPQAAIKSSEAQRIIPVNSTLASPPIPTNAAKTIQPEGKLEDDKRVQLIRELLAEKTELRSQRNALAMEKAALEAKLQVQVEEEEGRKALSARNDKQARELDNLRAKLVQEIKARYRQPVRPKPTLAWLMRSCRESESGWRRKIRGGRTGSWGTYQI